MCPISRRSHGRSATISTGPISGCSSASGRSLVACLKKTRMICAVLFQYVGFESHGYYELRAWPQGITSAIGDGYKTRTGAPASPNHRLLTHTDRPNKRAFDANRALLAT